jgi:ribonuclease HII
LPSRPTLQALAAAAAAGPPYDESFIVSLRADPRAGARKLLARCERRLAAVQAAADRVEAMQQFERAAHEAGHRVVAGVDEAGRGPLAGPIVAAAVVLAEYLPGLDDSKRLTEPQREDLFAQLQTGDHAIGVSVIAANEIDAVGIQSANYKAMLDALRALSAPPDCVLVDGFQLPECPYEQTRLVKGDRRSASIAAASIVAKVTRDRLMCELDAQFPAYGFAQHKGYGTTDHLAAIAKHGPCPHHRRSFALGTRHRQTVLPLDAGGG